MPEYVDEHNTTEDPHDFLLIARLLLESGVHEHFGLTFEELFPNQPVGASPKVILELEKVQAKNAPPKDQCPICLGLFEDELEAILLKLPCKHLFHKKCIIPWLEKAATCPYCRSDLPTDDELYEEFKRQQSRAQQRNADLEELHNSMYS
uniref:RING-type domain-containing protein n=1 Tax=Acrobeloides nanus TaxID=290746 RepID=A0A914C4Y9_9BILA